MRLDHKDSEQTSLLSARLKNSAEKKPLTRRGDAIDTSALRRNIETRQTVDSIPVFTPDGLKPENARPIKPPKKKKRERTLGLVVPGHGDNGSMQDAAKFDFEVEHEADTEAAQARRNAAIASKLLFALQIIIVSLCVYIGFLTFGLIQTRYVYNGAGQVVPEVLSVEDLETLAEYNTLSEYYLRARSLYEDALTIDFRLSTTTNDGYVLIAGEYNKKLEIVDKLLTDIAASVKTADSRYQPLYTQLNSWTKNDIALYLQEMSTAIAQNREDSANKALMWRNSMYSDFSKISENMYFLGFNTKGCTNLNIYDWSPEDYSAGLTKGG